MSNRLALLQKAASIVANLTNTLETQKFAEQKTASLVNSGVVNSSDAETYLNMFSGRTQADIELASQAVLATKSKSAGWGEAYVPPAQDWGSATGSASTDSLDDFILTTNSF